MKPRPIDDDVIKEMEEQIEKQKDDSISHKQAMETLLDKVSSPNQWRQGWNLIKGWSKCLKNLTNC